MINYFLYLFEFGAILAFVAVLIRERKRKEMLESLILAMIYGIILEILDVHFSKAYSYSKDFLFQIDGVPIAIGMGWAIIYYCAKKIVENYGLKWYEKPFLMALIALSFDLALDVVAIRLGFWSWKIPMDQEWFGVPFDNLVGWLAVVWTFSLFMNLGERIKSGFGRLIKYAAVVISPILLSAQITIYVTLSAVFSGKFTFGDLVGFYANRDFSYAYYPEVQRYKEYFFVLIMVLLVLFVAHAIRSSRSAIAAKIDYFSLAILSAAHLFFLMSIFAAGIYKKLPILVAVSAAMMLFHSAVSLLPAYAGKRGKF